MNSLRLKRHETFSIREGWLEKGINTINKNPECFRKDEGPSNFGLGSNMCKSLKYWLIATDIASFSNKAELTDFGELLLEYDKFLESSFSWFMIHAKLSMSEKDAPIINLIFNSTYTKFDKELLIKHLTDYFELEKIEFGAESSLESDVSVAIKSYCTTDISNPENNMSCPLDKLGLLGVDDKRNYYKKQPAYAKLNFLVIYYVMLECMKNREKNNIIDYNLEDLLICKNNPLKIFNISKSMLFLYLEEMKHSGLISLIKTAGLNTVHINKVLTLQEVFGLYFKEN